MIHDVLGSISSTAPRVALVLFLIFFAVVLAWALRGGRHRFDDVSRLPLEDDHYAQRISHEDE